MHELGNIRSLFRCFALLINTQPINTLVISHQQDSFSQNVSSFPLRVAVTTFSYLSRHNFVVFQTITFFVYFLLCNTAASHLRSFILTFRIFYSFHFLFLFFTMASFDTANFGQLLVTQDYKYYFTKNL